MTANLILRASSQQTLTLRNSLNDTPAIGVNAFGGGEILFPAGYLSTSLDVYASDDPNGTFVRCEDDSGTDLSMRATAERAVPLPTRVYKSRWIKLVTSADDSSRPVRVVLKG